MSEPLDRSFGYECVEPLERERRIRNVFRLVAPRYDRMNDFMSMGIHRLWKRYLVQRVAPRAGEILVDLAGGTGDVACGLAGADRDVVIVDPSTEMMNQGRRRRLPDGIRCLAGKGEAIPLKDSSVDAVTIAFGIRNTTSMEQTLAEVLRVLKPGGRFYCLEFSRPWAPIRPLYDLYSFLVIPRLGALVAGEPAAYAYLVESIRRFPPQEAMKALFEKAGFEDVGYRNLSLGIACVHWGKRATT
ncbi:class I SAM-dependent methyltransferase [Thiohalomonas denitrificans]|uniref:class I SAM-dependent methyltransferase n=1 Tax=Thiohalomonas denitrificans TaxID=415747 RepID=UPI0026ECF75C|nr:class I SAM-dependent methyltransferase [Thiohalomonas denitrificans]